MTEVFDPAPRNAPKALTRCRKKSCVYRAPKGAPYNCNYAEVTGHTRLSMIGESPIDPGACPLYKRGKRKRGPVKAVLPSARAAARKSKGRRTCFDWNEIRKAYDGGATDAELTDAFGVARSTLRKWRSMNHLAANWKAEGRERR